MHRDRLGKWICVSVYVEVFVHMYCHLRIGILTLADWGVCEVMRKVKKTQQDQTIVETIIPVCSFSASMT